MSRKNISITGLAVCIIVTAIITALALEKSMRRKVSAPTGTDIAYLKNFPSSSTGMNPYNRLGNVLFSTKSLDFGYSNEKNYKPKVAFSHGEEVHYRAYYPFRHIDLVNKIRNDAVSRGCQAEVVVYDSTGAKELEKFTMTFDYPSSLDWDQHCGGITTCSEYNKCFDPKFTPFMNKQKPGKYICRVYVFDKVSLKSYYTSGGRRYYKLTDPKFYLISRGEFTYNR